ncbi:MAG: TCR/Tet family MFS transporter [Henriciella sp.]|nr:TCR/Tet family MFS transporter [Henriciella sp.]
MSDNPSKQRILLFICAIIFFDAVGFGLLMPIMPVLLEDVANLSLSDGATIAGFLLTTFAVMQFVFAPILGGLSDRYGRRPVLLIALLGFAIDSFIMAWAPTLTWLFIARIISGIFGATYATCYAAIADISAPDERAKLFGFAGAALGLGFIFGPAIGGLLGEYWVRLPFIVAGGLILLVCLWGVFFFPETLKTENRRAFSWARANPLGSLISIGRFPSVLIILGALFLIQLGNHSYSSIWSFYVSAVANWTPFFIGLSISIYGFGVAGVQGGLTGPAIARFGEVKAVYFALGVGIVSFLILGFAQSGLHIYVAIVIGAFAGFLSPALQALMTQRTPADSQGELQGAISSLYSLAAIISPAVMAIIFTANTDEVGLYLPGAPFLLAAGLAILAIIVFAIGASRLNDQPLPIDQSSETLAEKFD